MTETDLAPSDVTPAFAPRLRDHVTFVAVEDEAILHDGDQGTLHLLDPIAALVCRLFDGSATLAQLADDLAAAFEVPRDRIEGDVVAMTADLGAQCLVDGIAGAADGVTRVEQALVDGC